MLIDPEWREFTTDGFEKFVTNFSSDSQRELELDLRRVIL